MIRYLALVLFMLPISALATPGDVSISQRNASDAAIARILPLPASGANGVIGLNGSTGLPQYFLLGTGLSLSGNTLTTALGWNDISGKPSFATIATTGAWADIVGKPTFATVAITGNALDLTNLAPVATSNQYGSLTGLPSFGAAAFMSPSTQGAALMTATTPSAARSILGAGTSSFSGNYNDLTNKPVIPDAITSLAWGSLTGVPTAFTPTFHTQTMASVSGLTATLAGITSTLALTKPTQATRTSSGTGGTGTWVFPTAFSGTPVVSLTGQDNTGAILSFAITAVSSTSVSYIVTRTNATVVALIGLTILSVSAPAATTVHIIASGP